MKKELIDIDLIKENDKNPRSISDDKFARLVKSIESLPEMLEARPIVLNKDLLVLGGNMRLSACKHLKMKKVWVVIADNLTAEQEREFLVKDNVNSGEWDWAILANEWEATVLNEWGMDVWVAEHDDSFKPTVNPVSKPFEVTLVEFSSAEGNFGSNVNLGNRKEMVGCKCPTCNYEFNIEKP